MDLQEGVKGLKNAVPHTDEERLEIFNLKKWIVNSLVERVTIDRERKLTVKIRLNLLDTPDTNLGRSRVRCILERSEFIPIHNHAALIAVIA